MRGEGENGREEQRWGGGQRETATQVKLLYRERDGEEGETKADRRVQEGGVQLTQWQSPCLGHAGPWV